MPWNGNAEAQRQADQAFNQALKKSRESRQQRVRKRRKFVRPNYHAYIRSSKWRRLTKRILELRGAICEQCGAKDSLHVHHLTYARLGRERPEDLQILCNQCHATVHEDVGVFSELAQEYFDITR